jgi:hypothetical protein
MNHRPSDEVKRVDVLKPAARRATSSKTVSDLSSHLVIVDSGVDDAQILLAGVVAGARTVVLVPDRDGIEQITETLQRYPDTTHLHIVSHGSPGCLYLGNAQLSLDTLDRYSWELQSWFASHPTAPTLLLYGCKVAANQAGLEFIQRLHQLTGAAIAASTTPTGCAELGGNWQLDAVTGSIAVTPAFTAETMAMYTALLATYTVTSTGDSGDPGTLRWAIAQVNAGSGGDTIAFDIGTAGSAHTINLSDALPAITQPTTIDGWSQSGAGYTGAPLIELNGSTAGTATNGLILAIGSNGSIVQGLVINRFSNNGIRIDSSNNTIRGNYIGTNLAGTDKAANQGQGIYIGNGSNNLIGGNAAGDRNLISGNQGHGITINGNQATGNQIRGNAIGTDVTGSVTLGNQAGGVLIGSSNTTVGGTTAGDRNLISGNGGSGVQIDGTATNATNNQILGNYIGTDSSGTTELGNTGSGVDIINAANNAVGMSSTGNLVSGNGSYGIRISGADATGNQVLSNLIGTNAAGTAALGNSLDGVNITAPDNIVGGKTAADRNIISGNQTGIAIELATATGNKILGNFIGTNRSGTAALGNTVTGISLLSANNTIGGAATGEGNLVSGNATGVLISGNQATGNQLLGNRIGTQANGSDALGNTDYGIQVAAAAANNVIGDRRGGGNTIAYSGQIGIFLEDTAGKGNAILGNQITANTGLGIDINGDGVTANDTNDTDTGANNLQNVPVLSAAAAGPATTVIGSFNGATNTDIQLDFFANAVLDPSGHGEGQTFLGFKSVTTDKTGQASFTVTLPTSTALGQFVTATATDPSNNTSEFSAGVATSTLVRVTAPDSTASESGNNPGLYRITRSNTSGSLTVKLAVDPSSTASQTDYRLGQDLTITLTDGQASLDIPLTPIADRKRESPETLRLNLVSSNDYITDPASGSAIITIADASAPSPTPAPTPNPAPSPAPSPAPTPGSIPAPSPAPTPTDGITGVAPAPINFQGGRLGIRLRGTSSQDRLNGTGKRDRLLGRSGNDRLRGNGGNDQLLGGNGNDRLIGGSGNDRLTGGNGGDRLRGNMGRDLLLGGNGNDTLLGGSGDDLLIGNAGADHLTGGAGSDLFRFDMLSDAGDRITDFEQSRDLIDLRGIFTAPQFSGISAFSRFVQFVMLEQVGANTEVKLDADGNGSGTAFITLVTLENQTVSAIGSRNFVIE